MLDYWDFEKWVNDNDLLYQNFYILKKAVKEYLNHLIRNDYEDLCKSVSSNFNTVLEQCDQISYNENGVPEAYIILHFLDRYHRFQLIFMDMLKVGCFPIKETISMIDIGTGPGPSMYAFSDMINLIQTYEEENCGKTTIKEVIIDYAEQSHGFRHFLHSVTEILIKDRKCYVPFHHGTYFNAAEMEFSGLVEEVTSIFRDGVMTYYQRKKRRAKKSFDMVIYSNFLTNMDVMKKYSRQIQNAVFHMRNRGALVVVGGNPEDKKYIPVYNKLDEIILKQRYNTIKYGGKCEKIINVQKMSYSGSDRFAKEIKSFYQEMIDGVTHNDWGILNLDFQNKIKNYLEGSKDEKWYLTVFRRSSFIKKEDK